MFSKYVRCQIKQNSSLNMMLKTIWSESDTNIWTTLVHVYMKHDLIGL